MEQFNVQIAELNKQEMTQAQLQEFEGGSLIGEVVKKLAEELVKSLLPPSGPQC